MPNSLYTYILHIYDLVWLGFIFYNILYFIIFLNELVLNSFYKQLNGFKYCYLILIILFNINRPFADREVFTFITIQLYLFYLALSIH